MRWLAPLALLLALVAAACADSGPLPPTGGEPVDEAALVFEGVSHRAAASQLTTSPSPSDLEQLGRGETQEGMVDVFRLRSGDNDWEVLTGSGERWVIWEPLSLQRARGDLSGRLDVPDAEVSTTEVTRVEWPDACLGAAGRGEVCAEVITPGFRIVLEAQSREHVYHSDLRGNVRPGP